MKIVNTKKSEELLIDLAELLEDKDVDELLELSRMLTDYIRDKQKEKSNKFLKTIEHAEILAKDILIDLKIAKEEGELEWMTTRLDIQNTLIINCEELLSVCKKLKLKGEQNV